jgi:N-acyl homoserine lactone hydrolase
MLALLLLACAHHIPEPTGTFPPLPAAPPAPADATALDALPALGENPVAGARPTAVRAPPPALRVCRVELATGTLPGGLVVAHGALSGKTPSTQSGLLLVHPEGTWLVDGGMAADFAAHLTEIPGLFGVLARASAKDWVRVATPADAVRAAGVAPETLTGVIPTHGHYDHLGGLLDLPAVPIWAPAEEIAAAEAAAAGGESAILPSEARGLLPRARPIRFDGPAVGPWPSSWDLFGDGSAIVVPMPGHTPGSVGVLVRTASGKRLLNVGDTVWVREGYEQRAPKSAFAQSFDDARAGTDLQIQRLWQLHRAEPDLVILPAHDRRQWEAAFGGAVCLD